MSKICFGGCRIAESFANCYCLLDFVLLFLISEKLVFIQVLIRRIRRFFFLDFQGFGGLHRVNKSDE